MHFKLRYGIKELDKEIAATIKYTWTHACQKNDTKEMIKGMI